MENGITVENLASLNDLFNCLGNSFLLGILICWCIYSLVELFSLWKLKRSIRKEGKEPISYICEIYMDKYFKVHPIEDPIAEKIAERLKEKVKEVGNVGNNS